MTNYFLSIIRDVVEQSSFVDKYGHCLVEENSQFGHSAIIIKCNGSNYTVAKIPGVEDFQSKPGVYIKMTAGLHECPDLASQSQLILNKNGNAILLDYRFLTQEWVEANPERFNQGVFDSLADAIRVAESAKVVKGFPLPAFTPAQKKLLRKVEIRHVGDIAERGYARIFLDVKMISAHDLPEDFLDRMYGAVNGIYHTRIPEEIRNSLRDSVVELSQSELRNQISMSSELAKKLEAAGYKSMAQVRMEGFESVLEKITQDCSYEDAISFSLQLYAACNKEGGASMQSLSEDALTEFLDITRQQLSSRFNAVTELSLKKLRKMNFDLPQLKSI
ncbi:TfoX/Sxy family DNA transformation protein [Vibrio barjaei]|uniref:TfoX/Sxy family DNA transformation protein n=1 Tax=Vibrio barjaei TaxID=1676683 RepID=UPI0022847DF4|nr:TfoX/Sxy family DNA transformation protein [Vibrio barjaei]MCY9872359.1 hypothetical protein [Vibrio barjaei]